MENSHSNISTELSENTSMKRFASIDFLRGLAIFVMLFLHMVADYLNTSTLMAPENINNIPLINVVAIIVLPLLGGLAGLFLIASSISNMVSMQKNLKRGKGVGAIVVKQITGGIILLLFAMLTEGLTGYHGSFGNFILNLNNPPIKFDIGTAMTGWATFEAIHTIAWCMILNGIVQGLLSIKGGWKKPRRQMIIYAILSIIVIVLTKFVWDGIYNGLIGSDGIGFPWGHNADGSRMDRPDLRSAGFGAVLVGIFLNPFAAPMEPIFPYLAISFIGSIIGIVISQPKKALFKGFTKTVLLTGFIMFVVGSTGTVLELVNVIKNIDLYGGIDFYRYISFHRHWYPDAPVAYADHITSLAWVWQTLITNGFSIMLCMIVIYLVEFRGRGFHFAKKTGYIRRYGVIAFSNYNNQWLYWIPILILGKDGTNKMTWGETFLGIFITLIFYTIVLYLWGLINYRFSFEWFMKSIGYVLLPIRRVNSVRDKKWWQKGDVDVKDFHNSEWINIVEENEAYHKAKTDSKVAMILSICSLAIPVFFAFSLVTLPMSIKARKSEGINKKNTIALVLSIIGVGITLAFLAFTFSASFSTLGVSL